MIVFEESVDLKVGERSIVVRRLQQRDSLEDLTALLHGAFSRLKKMEFNCACINQTVAQTRERVEAGDCYVALCNGCLVATLTLYRAPLESEGIWLHRPTVAKLGQFAVAPEFQNCGLGSALLDFAQDWAFARGYRELALTTPQSAKHLVTFYGHQGYRPVESIHLPEKNYRSVVLSKTLANRHAAPALMSSLLDFWRRCMTIAAERLHRGERIERRLAA